MEKLYLGLRKVDLHLYTVSRYGYSTTTQLVDYVCDFAYLGVIAVTNLDAIAGTYKRNNTGVNVILRCLLAK